MTTKPPTQVAGVAGIAPEPVTMNEIPASAIDWKAVASLPPFQMFAGERSRNTSGKDSMEHALDFVKAQGSGADVLQAYEEWHAAKGYWPNEDAYGRAR